MNVCDEVELVDEYVGVTVQKLCKGQHTSLNLTLSRQWLWVYRFLFPQAQRVFIVEHYVFNLDPI